MRHICRLLFVVGVMACACSEADAHGPGFWGGPGFGPHWGPSHHWGPTYGPPIIAPPVYYGGWGPGWGSWSHPGLVAGGFGYSYQYYTHLPGYSFSYYRGPVARYYPGPYGPHGFDYYGYGPYGW